VLDKRDARGLKQIRSEFPVIPQVVNFPPLGEFVHNHSDPFDKLNELLHLLNHHKLKIQLVFENSIKKLDLAMQYSKYLLRQIDGFKAFCEYLNSAYLQIVDTVKKWRQYADKSRLEFDTKLHKVDSTISKLSAIEIHPTLRKPTVNNLLDLITADGVKELYLQFRESQDQFDIQLENILSKIQDLEQIAVKALGKKFSLTADLQIKELEKAQDYVNSINKLYENTKEILEAAIQSKSNIHLLPEVLKKIPTPEKRDQQIKDITICHESVNTVYESMVNQKLKINQTIIHCLQEQSTLWIALIDFQANLDLFYNTVHTEHKELRKQVNTVYYLYQTYMACLDEIKRRIIWGRKYRIELQKFQDLLRTYTKREVEKRVKFLQKITQDRNIPMILFPGMSDSLPFAQIVIDTFDQYLPKMEVDSVTDSGLGSSSDHNSIKAKPDEEFKIPKSQSLRSIEISTGSLRASNDETAISTQLKKSENEEIQKLKQRIAELEATVKEQSDTITSFKTNEGSLQQKRLESETKILATEKKLVETQERNLKLEADVKRFKDDITVQIEAKKSAELLWKELKSKTDKTSEELETTRAQLAQISEFLGAIEHLLVLDINPSILPSKRLQNILTKLTSFIPTCIHTANFQHSDLVLAIIKEESKDIIQLFQYPEDSSTIPHFIQKELVPHIKNSIVDTTIFVCQIIYLYSPTTDNSQQYNLSPHTEYILVDVAIPRSRSETNPTKN